MRITGKIAQQMMETLDDLQKEINREHKSSKSQYPYAEWERGREKVKQRLEKLPEYIEQAASTVTVQKARGPDKELNLAQRTTLLLFARMMNKSNRDMEEILLVLQPLFKVPVSYKTIERLYSDGDVRLALHNLFLLLLRDESVSGDLSGDGTGYGLTITKHYRSSPKKKGKDYRYAFRLMDLATGMYVGVGYSAVSEMRAFHQATEMARGLDLPMDSLRLDRYYSSRKVLRIFGREVSLFILPKKNLSVIGIEWSRVIRRILEGPLAYLREYFRRNLSESGYSSDKRRFGGIIRQRREDRQESALMGIAFLHNLFFVRVPS